MRAIGYQFAVVWLVAACGGNSFTQGPPTGGGAGDSGARETGGPSPDASGGGPSLDASGGGRSDGSSAEAGDSGASPNASIPCGSKACSGTTPVCCLGTTPDCAHLQCGCATTLNCASDADCSPLTPVCCIGKRTPDATCATPRTASRCEVACLTGTVQMCDPAANTQTCITGQCSSDSGDLQSAGLPANDGYGVCK